MLKTSKMKDAFLEELESYIATNEEAEDFCKMPFMKVQDDIFLKKYNFLSPDYYSVEITNDKINIVNKWNNNSTDKRRLSKKNARKI